MFTPQQGIHDRDRVGFCPHCDSSNIEIRRRRHRSQLWRCRDCTRAFPTPSVREIWFAKSNARNYVFATEIPRLERRVRIRLPRSPGRRRKPYKSAVALGIILVVLAVAAWWWLTSDPGSRSGESLFHRNSGASRDSIVQTTQNKMEPGGTLTGRSVEPLQPVLPTHPMDSARELVVIPVSPPAPNPTPSLIPTLVPPPESRHLEEKRFMLDLINDERARHRAGPVVLGDNIAAQLHAESALANCFSSHWGLDGLKPYMRYSLAGGYQSNGENGHGSDYCIRASDRYRPISSIRTEIREAMAGWMESPGHRQNILEPSHMKVNIGIAWDRYNVQMFQHFEGDYVEYQVLPQIHGGDLKMLGRTRNGAHLGSRKDLGVQVYYDPPPGPLKRGQVARTYCYDNGLLVASQRERLTDGSFWTEDQFTTTYSPCPDPSGIPADAPPAKSLTESNRLWQEAYDQSKLTDDRTITVPWITAGTFRVGGGAFDVEADISQVMSKHGEGVYSVIVWGLIDDQDTVISEYSIFHGVTPPDTYNPGGQQP